MTSVQRWEPPEPTGELDVIHDPTDGEVVTLPPRPPIDLAARPAAPVPRPWETDEVPRLPIVAEWVRDLEQLRRAVTWWCRGTAHRIGYHAVRSPIYAALILLYSPRGLWRACARVRDWVADGDARPLRDAAKERGDDATFLRYRTEQKQARDGRRWQLRIGVTAVLAASVTLHLAAPWWLYWPVVTATVTGLGLLGQSPDRPIVTPAIIPNTLRKLSPGVVLRAFEAAGFSTEADPITFVTPIQRDANGWSVILDLPFGKTADRAIAKRDEIASGLDVDERQVFISRVRGATGSMRRIHVWVCEIDPLSVPAGPSELIQRDRVNFWEPWPFGKNERGDTVELCVLWAAMLIGAIPRRGKTFVARLVALAAALDPHVKLYIFDQKGSPDWTPFEHVADRIFYGDRADPDTGVHPLAALRDTVNDLLAEVDRRNRVLRTLPKTICPEGKLTETISRTKSFGMPLILLVVDEVQRGFSNKEFKAELETALTDLAKVGPSVGIITVCATQKPDAQSTPTGFRDQFGIRFALYVTTSHASEAVLGAGAGGEGMHAHRLPPDAPGSGILRGTGDAAINGGIVRTGYASGADAEQICLRGRALREAAGTLDGMALGHIVTATPLTYSVTTDLAVVLGGDEKAHSDVLCARLAERWPDRYAGWTPIQLAAALKPDEVRPRQVWAPSLEDGVARNRQGILRADLLGALDD